MNAVRFLAGGKIRKDRIKADQSYFSYPSQRTIDINQTGLIVHGPLTALVLLHTFSTLLVSPSSSSSHFKVKSFEYKALAPLVVGTPVKFCASWEVGDRDAESGIGEGGERRCRLWVEDADGSGRVYMSGVGICS